MRPTIIALSIAAAYGMTKPRLHASHWLESAANIHLRSKPKIVLKKAPK